MTLKEIANKLELSVVAGEDNLETEVSGVFTSDMLSNVVGNAKEGDLWITIQTHPNILAVAMLRELPAILIAQGEEPTPHLVQAADEKEMPILTSSKSAYELCGELYTLLSK